MGSYWSIEECRWVEYPSAPEPVTQLPEQREAEDELELTPAP